MTSDRGFEACREQLVLISEWMSASRAASSFEDREAKLKAACERAILSLGSDLQAISDLEERLVERHRDTFEECRDTNDRRSDLHDPTGGCGMAQRISPKLSSPPIYDHLDQIAPALKRPHEKQNV